MKKKNKNKENESKIELLEYSESMKKDYLDYAIEVAIDRTIPDARDGLKPVHRRILFAMHELKLFSDGDYRKCARIVGDVLGKYHPHGDSSVYDALVRMAQDFKMRLPLVDGHGNFGSIDGDSSAAMRYTEAKMTSATKYMLNDLEKGVVNFKDNFDGTLKEPVVLPSILPNLLINGSTGIAVGLSTSMPPHNPTEVIDTILEFMNNKNLSVSELIKTLKGPDYPTGGIITNKKDIIHLYETGEGSLTIRAKIEVEEGTYGKTNLVIKEIPFTSTGNKSKLIESIIDAVNNRTLDELSDVRDESDKEDMRIVLEVKKNVNIEKFLNKLFKKTALEKSEKYSFLILKDGYPKQSNLKEIIEIYVDFQKEILSKKLTYLLEKNEKRIEILNGMLAVKNDLDLIIEVIRGSSTVKQAKMCLVEGNIEGINFKTKKNENKAKKLKFTENQANAILKMELHRLVGLELDALKEEVNSLLKETEKYKKILSSDKETEKEIKKELKKLREEIKFKRRTQIIDVEKVVYTEEFIEEEICIALDKFNYIKSLNTNLYTEENKKNFKYFDKVMNTDSIRVFSNLGKVYKIKANNIVLCKLNDKGIAIETLCGMDSKEYPIYIDKDSSIQENKFLVATKLGLIKRLDGSELKTIRKSVGFTTLNKDDEVISITPINDEKDEVLVITHRGLVLKYDLKEVNSYKKTSKGDKSVILNDNDYVEDTTLISKRKTYKINGKEYLIKDIEKKKRYDKAKPLI